MRKFVIVVLFILSGGVVSANAQVSRLQTREAQWKSYSLPQTNFDRHLNPDKNLIFRMPADWKQQGGEMVFTGPHSSSIRVIVQKVPDGYPLQDFFGAVVQFVRDSPGVAETLVTRQTQLQDLEAREIFLEAPDAEGEIVRSTTWITVNGPLAVTFNFKAPVAHADEVEPFFKALVQSVIFIPHDYSAFETLRSSHIKTPTPGPIHEVEKLVAALNGINPDRQTAITRLSALFSSHEDVAVDLLLDRRPLIRAAAVEALARTGNDSLVPFLWEMIDDREPHVAQAAARAVASTPDVIAKTINHSLYGLHTPTIARIWPFLSRDRRIELLQRVFSQTAVNRPPPEAAGISQPAKGKVIVDVVELAPVKPGGRIPDVRVAANVSNDPHVQIGALSLLRDLTAEDFKLPLARIVASNHDPLIALGLQVANQRREPLPLDALFKLAASSNSLVKTGAIQSLAVSATVSDIPRIEALISKDGIFDRKAFDDEIKLSIKKIRFRHELAAAKSASESRAIIAKAQSDPSLAAFAWFYDCEASVAGCMPSIHPSLKGDFRVKPFAENLLPKKVQLYSAIPKPAEAVQKFYETLQGLQMESPRAQSNLVFTMGIMRQQLARQLSAPVDADALVDYTGIDPDSPIALAAWTPAGSSDSASSALRRAIVLRVKDRVRFERAVERFQETSGNFMNLTDLVGGLRGIAALPAILPFSAQEVLAVGVSKPDAEIKLKYSFIGEKEWNGLRITTIEQRRFDLSWQIEAYATHLAFIGDTVIITPDLTTLRDLLFADSGREHLAENAEFQKAIQRGGDVVYFSDLKAVLTDAFRTSDKPVNKFNESGSLRFSSSSWENSHYFAFDESDWAQSFLQFDPKELSAPRNLLPASTIAYYFMKLDLGGAWPKEFKKLLPANAESLVNLWALDLNREVLPELGPECGAAMLEFPDIKAIASATWAIFCKLKSNKLAEELKAGELFLGVGPTNDFAEVKIGDVSYFVGVRNGFLVVSNLAQGLAALDGKTNLAATRDYSRAVEKVPGGIVAFGGYNLEAAIAAANKTSVKGERAEIAELIFSVASAFHSQNFYATTTGGAIEARSSVAMDREGRYPLSDVSFVPRGTNITLATVDARGVPITDQKRLTTLVLKIRAKAPGPIDNIKDDIKTADQIVEQRAANELLLTVAARRHTAEKAVQLPVKDPALAEYLKVTSEFPADNKDVMDQAREIAGNDKDAWSVARKLADWTYQNLEWKHVVSAGAAQTLATREADCTEFSQLFVAMARSRGLPARMVSGLAYSGNSFGGHAWVEVWAGKWIELDPTWGTHFVDATHIRNASNTLLTSAALNLIELEVLETKRTAGDFQQSPRALAEHLVRVIPSGNKSEIEAAIDLPALTDEFMGAGAWSKMSDDEREQMWSAYRRIMYEIITGYRRSESNAGLRLLHLEEKGDEAEAICLEAPDDTFVKLRLVRRNEAWYLAELVQADTELYLVSETLRPVITRIERKRAGETSAPAALPDFFRALLLIETNAARAVEVVDNALQVKSSDKGLRFLKVLAFLNMEDREKNAVNLLRELSDEALAPAVFKLAQHLEYAEEGKEINQAVELYERYTSLEPYDPRGFNSLAIAYDKVEECDKAEAAYRKAIDIDSGRTFRYLNLIEYLALHDRVDEIRPVLEAGEKHQQPGEDLFGAAVENLYFAEESESAEELITTEPSRMKSSYTGNVILGRIHLDNGRYAAALRFFNIAAQLDPKATYPHTLMAQVHRKQLRWAAALRAAQRAIDLDATDSEAYYQRACTLARLGRIKEAMSALEKAVELDPFQASYIAEEKDLKALRSLPAFKKLLPEP